MNKLASDFVTWLIDHEYAEIVVNDDGSIVVEFDRKLFANIIHALITRVPNPNLHRMFVQWRVDGRYTDILLSEVSNELLVMQ